MKINNISINDCVEILNKKIEKKFYRFGKNLSGMLLKKEIKLVEIGLFNEKWDKMS